MTGPARPPAKCAGCQVNRVAWANPRVDYCYDCLPGGPFPAPTCRACKSPDYFSDGLCQRCHPGGPNYLDSCRGCLAWGVSRAYGWMCWSCRWWVTHYPLGTCQHCRRTTRIGAQAACRLCLEQARIQQEPGRALNLPSANRDGQQLFIANHAHQRRKTPRLAHLAQPGGNAPRTRKTGTQLTLFHAQPDPGVIRARVLAKDQELQRQCKAIVAEHAATHGWSKRQRNDVTRSLRLLAILQETPGGKIRASEVLQLPRYDGNIISTIDVLAAAGLLIEDRPTAVERYFANKTAELPEPMKHQLEVWLEVMLNGSTTPPRQRTRDPQTARIHIMGIVPIISNWATAGHRSFAEITPEQVRACLPATGSRRNFAEYGLKSLFTTLKSKKLIFTNPTRGMPNTPVNATIPLPLDTAAIRCELDSPKPGVALSVALVAFHALTDSQLRNLKTTDIIDGHLTIGERTIPLADPVTVRLTAWLDHRARTWPNTLNQHLIINQLTAPRELPVGRGYWQRTRLRPQALREDRILQEIHATGGDVRRVCDLFGLSIEAAMRYTAGLTPTDQPPIQHRVPRTQ